MNLTIHTATLGGRGSNVGHENRRAVVHIVRFDEYQYQYGDAACGRRSGARSVGFCARPEQLTPENVTCRKCKNKLLAFLNDGVSPFPPEPERKVKQP